ncbi:MAG: PIN domain-containing protein [Chloroflexota bacterium]
METIFVDTSAFLALVNANEDVHQSAVDAWDDALASGAAFVTSNYVVVESVALIQNRLGIHPAQQLSEELLPLIEVHWIGEEQHGEALDHVIAANRRNLSLVDCSSFSTMRRLDIHTVFTFDDHFREQGFRVIP